MTDEYSESEIEEMAYDAIWEFVPERYRDDVIELEDVEHQHSENGIHTLHVFGSPLGDFDTSQIYQAEVDGQKVQFTVDGGVGLGQFEIRFTPRGL